MAPIKPLSSETRTPEVHRETKNRAMSQLREVVPVAIARPAKNQKGSDRSHRDVDEDDLQRPTVNNLLHRWRDVPSSVVRTFRIDR